MKLIAGLGNPGFQYRNTRHNAGFLVIKAISKKFRIRMKKRKYAGILGKGLIGAEKVSLFIPQTYMNLSGEALREIVKSEKINAANLLVICDDINLKFGFTRLRKKGSAGGHKGLQSAIKGLGTSEFPRLRIGVGKNRKITDVVKFVLSPFDSGEKRLLRDILQEAAECAVLWTTEGADKAMLSFNRRQFAVS